MTPYYDRDGITIYCGDCLGVMPQLEPGSFDAVITDPPYGIDYQSAWRTDKTQRHKKIVGDEKPFAGWGADSYRVSTQTGVILVFYRWDVQESFVDELGANGWIVKSQIIWDKEAHGMGDLNGEYAPQHENILFARKADFSFPGKRPTTIIKCPKVPAESLLHPNEKPIDLIARLMVQVTKSKQSVLDFSMGSGTTLVAAQREGRRAVGIEICEDYCKIAVERLKQPSFWTLPAQPKPAVTQAVLIPEIA